MALEIARYRFLSWLRKGISTSIGSPDDLGLGTSVSPARVSVQIPVIINDEPVGKDFQLLGPGDITGINSQAIVRNEPLHRSTDFEPNYLAFVEFYDEDFAWRYTPASEAAVDGTTRLRPWISLLVLEEGEFTRTKRQLPLPSIFITDVSALPPSNETWLWAHVHSNAVIPDSELSEHEKFLLSLNSTLTKDPDQVYSRLMSPRKLEQGKNYYAFIVPSFETGRKAGLGEDPQAVNGQLSSWTGTGVRGEMPVYYEWSFSTGQQSDFESLVKLLEPRRVDPRVGIRDMDCSAPSFVKADGSEPFPGTSPIILGLEGALRSPESVSTVFPSPLGEATFQVELEKLVNLPFDMAGAATAGDPVISVPFYGELHARRNTLVPTRLEISRTDWVHDLNKDPRTRVAAGFGTSVVQVDQERFMKTAWQQVETVVAANRKLRLTRYSIAIASVYTKKIFNKLPDSTFMAMSRPLFSRVRAGGKTVQHTIAGSTLSSTAFAPSFRKLVGKTEKTFNRSNVQAVFNFDTVIRSVNAERITGTSPVTGGTSPVISSNPPVIGTPPLIGGAGAVFISRADILFLDPSPTAERVRTPFQTNFITALNDLKKQVDIVAPAVIIPRPNLETLATNIREAIDPKKTFVKRLKKSMDLPLYLPVDTAEQVNTIMAYPDCEEPMYAGLTSISDELLIPNLKLIPPNTITLVKSNPRFIESYLVGLNHEMNRELLWREYPTDQRGTFFRQFWDTRGLVQPSTAPSAGTQAQQLKDITPIHSWDPASLLGTHTRTAVAGKEQLVLMVRGDLLRKYPNTVIFAQKAVPVGPDGELRINQSIGTMEEFIEQVKFPQFAGEIKPDIRFFGFDLTIDQARGSSPTTPFTDTHGWFFVIQEVPGQPRFGMDLSNEVVATWNDLAWDSFTVEPRFISKTQVMKPNSIPETEKVKWGRDAATMAQILFQQPSMIIIHSLDMLENL